MRIWRYVGQRGHASPMATARAILHPLRAARGRGARFRRQPHRPRPTSSRGGHGRRTTARCSSRSRARGSWVTRRELRRTRSARLTGLYRALPAEDGHGHGRCRTVAADVRSVHSRCRARCPPANVSTADVGPLVGRRTRQQQPIARMPADKRANGSRSPGQVAIRRAEWR